MIPGFSAAPMMMARKSGGPVATGRVKFEKSAIDANNYQLAPSDKDIYTNGTGHDIGIIAASMPDLYSFFGLPSPYCFLFQFYDGVNLVEYPYSSATLGFLTLSSPVFYPGVGYVHESTSVIVASFAADVWYDFTISKESPPIDPNVYVIFEDVSGIYGLGAVGYAKAGALGEGSPPFGSVTNDQFFGSTLAVLIIAPEFGIAGFTGDPANVTGITSVKVGTTTFTVESTDQDGDFTTVYFTVPPGTSFNPLEPYTLEFIK